MPALHGVLVTHKRGDQLRHYLGALAAQTRPLDSLIVVDNDPAESARTLVDQHQLTNTAVRYLPTGENIGPAGGIAVGMRRVLEHAGDVDWMITLDDDDPPRTPELLEVLLEFGVRLRSEDPTVAAVGLCGGRFDERRVRFTDLDDRELVGPVPSSWIGGNQLPMYNVGVVRDVGVFNDRLFINFEELEYGLRLEDHGYRLCAHGELWRRERAQFGRTHETVSTPSRRLGDPSWRRYYSLRNMIYLLRARRRRWSALRFALLNLVKPIYNLPRSPTLAWAHLRLNARAVTDAYRGRMGRTVAPQPKVYG